MKTTLEIPDNLFRQAKAAAARQGIPLRELVTEALAAKLSGNSSQDRPWMKSFGELSALRNKTARIDKIMDREFGQIEPEDLRRILDTNAVSAMAGGDPALEPVLRLARGVALPAIALGEYR